MPIKHLPLNGRVHLPLFSKETIMWGCPNNDLFVEPVSNAPGIHPLQGWVLRDNRWYPVDLTGCPPKLNRIKRTSAGELIPEEHVYQLAGFLCKLRGQHLKWDDAAETYRLPGAPLQKPAPRHMNGHAVITPRTKPVDPGEVDEELEECPQYA